MFVISKLLNHSNTQTTEKFYLKENITDLTDRAKIPWLDKSNKPKNIVPSFLNVIKKDDTEKIKRKMSRLTAVQLNLDNISKSSV